MKSQRITKTLIENVVHKATKKLYTEISEIKQQKRELIIDAYKKTIPNELIDVYKKYNSYFYDSVNCIKLNGVYVNVSINNSDGIPQKNTYYIDIENVELGDKVFKLDNKIDDVENNIKTIQNTIRSTMNNFTTTKLLLKEIPEFEKYIEEKEKPVTTVAKNYDTIKQLLKTIK